MKTKVPVHACWSPEKHQYATYFRKMAANFVCNICGKQFMSENALYDHNKGVHNEVESPCTQCDKAFRSKVKKKLVGGYVCFDSHFHFLGRLFNSSFKNQRMGMIVSVDSVPCEHFQCSTVLTGEIALTREPSFGPSIYYGKK